MWLKELENDEDAEFLQEGIQNGFQLTQIGTRFNEVNMDNYRSATNSINRHLVEQTIREELSQGNYVITKQKPTIVSALGAIPKPNTNEIRIIHDCSRPHGQAVNDYITNEHFQFQKLDDAIKLLKPNYFMAKIDLRHAYRSVPIHPDNYRATGCKWRFSGDNVDTYFYDTRLPFGAKSSPLIFHRLTQSVRRMMSRRGYDDIIVYLDDFLVIGATEADCRLAYDTLRKLLQDLGFTLSERKLIPPTQRLTFLGVELDTISCSMRLPDEKVEELRQVVCEFQSKRRASKKQLQRLAGKLNFACRVVHGGRTFLRRILDTMNNLSFSAKSILDEQFKEDINWWGQFLKVFNGTRLFLETLPTEDVVTDACNIAAAGFFRGDWYYHNFPIDSQHWANLHINHKETLAIILAAKRWAPLWANKRIVIHSDNQAAVQIINKGTTANGNIMRELRQLFWLSALHNFHIKAVYLEGKRNILADSISRIHEPQHLLKFHAICSTQYSQTFLNSTPLELHMSAHSYGFVFCRCTGSRPGKAVRNGNQ